MRVNAPLNREAKKKLLTIAIFLTQISFLYMLKMIIYNRLDSLLENYLLD